MKTTEKTSTMYRIVKLSLMMVICLYNSMILMAQDTPSTSLKVIGHEKGVPSQLALAQLRSVLKGEKQRWEDGTKVVIALMKTNTPIGRNTGEKIYNMSENELKKYWLALVFQGKAEAPTFFNSESELEAYVSQTPGAIGVISGAKSNSTKTVTVEGKEEI
jgi:ABC-type phosphate transport system substrate-binding protein